MDQELIERQLMEQERFLEGTVSVREILAYIESDRYLSLTEASEYLGISKRTLRDLADVPKYRVGTNMLLFKKSELENWMSQYREGGNTELDDLLDETLANVLGD